MTKAQPTDLGGFLPEPVLNQGGGPPTPIMWAAHTPDEHRHYLEDLDLWVTWLTNHYSLDRRYIPECWTKHWELIEELSVSRVKQMAGSGVGESWG